MANFETILTHQDANMVRIISVALKAHGFHPLDEGVGGPLGLPGVASPRGVRLQVPAAEAEDAKLLADVLVGEMTS